MPKTSTSTNNATWMKKLIGYLKRVVQYAPRLKATPHSSETVKRMCRGMSTQRSLRLRSSLPGFRRLVTRRVVARSTRYCEQVKRAKVPTIVVNLKWTSRQKKICTWRD